jgi:hypothetical protein
MSLEFGHLCGHVRPRHHFLGQCNAQHGLEHRTEYIRVVRCRSKEPGDDWIVGDAWACTNPLKSSKVCLRHREKCRPEEWRFTVIPQFRLRCYDTVAVAIRGSP